MALNAQSDVGVGLFHSATGASASYTKLVSITSVPATGSAKPKIETTELDALTKQYIADRADLPDMEFGYNYTDSNYTAVEAVCDQEHYFMIIYGDGTGVVIHGEANTWIDTVSRGQAIEAKLNIVPQSVDRKTAVEVTALKTA